MAVDIDLPDDAAGRIADEHYQFRSGVDAAYDVTAARRGPDSPRQILDLRREPR